MYEAKYLLKASTLNNIVVGAARHNRTSINTSNGMFGMSFSPPRRPRTLRRVTGMVTWVFSWTGALS